MDMKQFDGFYFLPGDEENQMMFSYFVLKEDSLRGKPVDNTKVGDMYHIAFFRQNEMVNQNLMKNLKRFLLTQQHTLPTIL